MFRPSKDRCSCGNPKSQVAAICLACRRKRVVAACRACGRAFEHAPSRPRLACSPTCADRLRANGSRDTQSRKVAFVCKRCGTERLVSPSRNRGGYCSSRCAADARMGAGNRRWKGGVTSKQRLFFGSSEWKRICRDIWARDRGRCRLCRKRPERGEVHHIATWGRFPKLRTDPGNLILLCYGCHKWVHSRTNTEGRFIRRTR